jgi:carboxymethylenebutenolidase
MGADLTIYLPGEAIGGYLAIPPEPGPAPGLVVLHQAFGLDDDIRRITDRLASMGYLAVAPDLLAGGRWRCLATLFRDVMRGRGPSVERAAEVVAWLSARADNTGKVGVIGFCLGGGLAYLLGAVDRVEVVAANYGKPPPVSQMPGLCPVVASYGARDRVFGRAAGTVERGLAAAGVAHDVKLYPGAGHGFMNQAEGHGLLAALIRPLLAVGYDREAAEDSWRRIDEFFNAHLT